MTTDNKSGIIVHVSEVDISESTGMGRVEFHWREAFKRKGYEFLHIGPAETGNVRHKSLFPSAAYEYFKSKNVRPVAFIIHEPSAGRFLNEEAPVFVESHGIERRYWELQLKNQVPGAEQPSLKTRLLFPFWRLRGCDKGLRNAHKLLLINSEDAAFARKKYSRSNDDIFIFKNGVFNQNSLEIKSKPKEEHAVYTILFNGNWIPRKGTGTLVKAAELIQKRGYDNLRYLIIGSGMDRADLINDWPASLREKVEVVKNFHPDAETEYLRKSDLFILPSYFEGQPLSLLQAMANGICCISTGCCGQKDIIKDGETGYLFPPGDYMRLADIMENCYKNRVQCLDIAEKARTEMTNRDWRKVSDQLADYVISSAETYQNKAR